MNKKEKDILTGLILSDAHLRQPKSNHRVHMSFTLKHQDFAKEIIHHLGSLVWRKSIFHDSYFDKRTKKTYYRNQIRTGVSDYLTSIYPNWYKDKKKIIPPNLTLTSTVLLWWYLGDGHLHKKKGRPNYRRVCLSTDSFCLADIHRLIDSLMGILGDSSVYAENNRIMIGRDALCSMASMLGDTSPVPSYQYKFDFGQYFDPDYKSKSYENRPLTYINKFRKKHKIRELKYVNKNTILAKEKQNGSGN